MLKPKTNYVLEMHKSKNGMDVIFAKMDNDACYFLSGVLSDFVKSILHIRLVNKITISFNPNYDPDEIYKLIDESLQQYYKENEVPDVFKSSFDEIL
jgi:hypothetical protein